MVLNFFIVIGIGISFIDSIFTVWLMFVRGVASHRFIDLAIQLFCTFALFLLLRERTSLPEEDQLLRRMSLNRSKVEEVDNSEITGI
jgi:hypothetical protein